MLIDLQGHKASMLRDKLAGFKNQKHWLGNPQFVPQNL